MPREVAGPLVHSECLPYSAIPHTTRIFQDHLYQFERVRRFYAEPPRSAEWIREHSAVPYQPERRARVADVLTRQAHAFGAPPAVLGNVERLRRGALAVVTGQQVSLFGGPALAMYKALHAIKVAEEFTRAGVDSVPIFWMATEDHDVAEIDHVQLPERSGELRTLRVTASGPTDAPVGSLRFDESIVEAVRQAGDVFGGEIATVLRDCYCPGATFGSAYARLFTRLFGRFGLILVDPLENELHALAQPLFAAALGKSGELVRALQARGTELEQAGYHQQVKVTPRSTLLFAIKDGARVPVHRRNGGFVIADEEITAERLLAETAAHPERFSANALLRPVMQDYLLPTAVYIGGPAEVAYFAQAEVVYRELLERVTPILPRFGATVVEPTLKRILDNYGVAVADVSRGPEKLRELLASRKLPASVLKSFDSATAAIGERTAKIVSDLERLDPTLIGAATRAASKMRYQLDRLQGRAARALLRREQEIARHSDRLSAGLYPEKTLQERVFPGMWFLGQHGEALLDDVLGQIRFDCLDHQVLYL
jgi:bacillithiol synthase